MVPLTGDRSPWFLLRLDVSSRHAPQTRVLARSVDCRSKGITALSYLPDPQGWTPGSPYHQSLGRARAAVTLLPCGPEGAGEAPGSPIAASGNINQLNISYS